MNLPTMHAQPPTHLVRHASGGAEYRNFGDVFRRCALIDLNGLPFPVHYQNMGVVQAWRDILCGVPLWRQLLHPERSCADIRRELDKLVIQPLLHATGATGTQSWRRILPLAALQSGALIKFESERGKVIDVTPALETLLINSDADLDLPMSLVAPQFSAQYIKFGPIAANALSVPDPIPSASRYDGAFCFLTPPLTGDSANAGQWSFELVFIIKRGTKFDGHISLTGRTDRMHGTLGEWLTSVLSSGSSIFTQASQTPLEDAVSYLVKVLLYMGLPNVMQTVNPARTDAQLRLDGLGPRKQSKWRQRLAHLYDSIVVGPTALPADVAHGERGGLVTAHWRRGHFRMQPCGPNRQERKLIFISPILVHAAHCVHLSNERA